MRGTSDDRYEGFRAFVESRSGSLLRTAYLLSGDPHGAEDLVQIALARVADRWPCLRDGDPEAYARRIIYNEHVSAWRRLRHKQVSPWADVPERTDHAADFEDGVTLRLALHRALASLPARQRAVLVLRYLDDATEAQAAAVLGCSVGTVKSQTHDALRRLRRSAPELAGVLGSSGGRERQLIEEAPR